MTLPRRALGLALLVAAAGALVFAARLAPAVAPVDGPGAPVLLAPSPFSNLATPALLAAGSILLVTGLTALTGSALSARSALVAPAVGGVAGIAFGVNLTDPVVVLSANIGVDAVEMAISGSPGAVAAGAVVGGAIAPVVRASITGDTVALLVGAVLLLAVIAAAAHAALALVAGGVGGAVAVAMLVSVDEAWRP